MTKTKVAVIGCGTIGRSQHVPGYAKNPDVEIKYLCDIIPQRATALAEQYHVPNTVGRFQGISWRIKKSSVFPSAPPTITHSHLHRLPDAGKNVLCEKPASVDMEMVNAMKAAADRSGKILNIGVVNRSTPRSTKSKKSSRRVSWARSTNLLLVPGRTAPSPAWAGLHYQSPRRRRRADRLGRAFPRPDLLQPGAAQV